MTTAIIVVRAVKIVLAASSAATQSAVAALVAAHLATAGIIHAAAPSTAVGTALEPVTTVEI